MIFSEDNFDRNEVTVRLGKNQQEDAFQRGKQSIKASSPEKMVP